MILSVLLAASVGALLWLDRVYVFQLMISRPIILSPLVGLSMGNLSTGLIVGASLELLWLNAPPVGAFLPNDESFCAAAATPAAVFASLSIPNSAATGLALVVCLPFALLGRSIDTWIRTKNESLLTRETKTVEKAVSGAMVRALIRSYSVAFAALLVIAGMFSLLIPPVTARLPGFLIKALSFMPTVTIVIGLAGLITKDSPRLTRAGLFVLGMVIVLTISWVL
jgi:mannose/fructose/N-acetylgalactosamine-specific phosphotransferase system component IIC